ncbi:hypothetical protein KIKIMORA_02860 [Brevundimonas phage vB_BpoS-Kikimora]|uniref:Uncharacterized protein n=1 Tax=Brevundimonas phage vB_BpoS-Kikimora TaxID=2948601 RepID=A0A9E7SMU5_9CAUD|nr:hypothetical protein KIKIMORA_02860 [Brevundimonas phage vB_BpoS-Kikimora]
MHAISLRIVRVGYAGFLVERRRWFGWRAVAARSSYDAAVEEVEQLMLLHKLTNPALKTPRSVVRADSMSTS